MQIWMLLLYYSIPRTTFFYTILYYTILYYTILYFTLLYYTILHYTMLCYTRLHYDIISELADLIGQKKERVAGTVACFLDNKMCLHCSRAYLREWLTEKDLVAYDRPQHWCKCED